MYSYWTTDKIKIYNYHEFTIHSIITVVIIKESFDYK